MKNIFEINAFIFSFIEKRKQMTIFPHNSENIIVLSSSSYLFKFKTKTNRKIDERATLFFFSIQFWKMDKKFHYLHFTI